MRIVTVNVVSVVTTTGFALGDYSQWGGFAVLMFFYLTFVGGCSGSTAGGLKIFRFQVAYVMLKANMQQMIHPRAVIKQQYNNHTIDEDIVRSLVTLSFFFTITIGVIALGLALIGLDWITALTGAATAVCNVGPGLGQPAGQRQVAAVGRHAARSSGDHHHFCAADPGVLAPLTGSLRQQGCPPKVHFASRRRLG
ncbi:Trk system potassium uptake protein TrkG [compost metagenome]